MKKICIFTNNRADYNKLEPIINYIHNNDNFELYLIVYGSHIIYDYGNTINSIKYPIYEKFNSLMYGNNNKIMAESCGIIMNKVPQILDKISPDAIIIHGDRFDIFPIALCASLMNICLIHIEGGELTGTIDEHLRHSISKLATYHFVCNKNAKKILEQMGEKSNNIFNIGCPSYDKILNLDRKIEYLSNLSGNKYNINLNKNNYILCLYHPVTTNIEESIKNYNILIDSLIKINKKILFFYPNVDNGSKKLVRIINQKKLRNNDNFLLLKTLEFEKYITLLSYCSCIIGNSSSAIREACIFGIPSIVIGTRQKNREISDNVHHLETIETETEMTNNILKLYGKRYKPNYLYGNGNFIKNFSKIINNLELRYKEKTFVIK